MGLKLRKISKLNIVMSAVMCAVLLFCFCSKSYVVQAADTSDSVDYSGLHYANIIHKSGYWDSQGPLEHTYCTDDCPKTAYSDFTDKDLYGQHEAFHAFYDSFIKTYYPDYKGVTSTFDLYVISLEGYEYDNTTDYCLKSYYLLVPKGSLVCMRTGMGVDDGTYGIKYVYIKTPVLGQKCLFMYFSKIPSENKVYCTSYPYYCDGYNQYQGLDNQSSYTDKGYNVQLRIDRDTYPKYRARLVFTNIPEVGTDWNNIGKFFSGDTSVATNAHPEWTGDPDGNNTTAGKKIGCDSIYWDDMSCSVSSVGSSKYAFKFDYTYSCSDLINYPSDCYVKVVYNADIRYQDGKGRIKSNSFSQEDLYSLAKHPNSFVNSNLYINSGLIDSAGSSGYNKLLELTDGLVGLFGHVDLDLESNTDITVKNAKLYVTVFLYEFDHDEELPGMRADYFENSNLSSDVRSFSFDLFTLKEDTSGAKVKPTVSTEDVVDDDGNVVGKKVTDAVVNDDDGKTVVNITIDNSNKVEDKNNNVNVPVNGGGGSSDSDNDKNTTSFWKYVTAFTAFINALLNADKGLFKVIAAYFSFIPGEFWDVTLGGIAVVIVLSIYRLAKKG